MKTQCKQRMFEFQGIEKRKVEVDFSGGYLSSDAGALLLMEYESKKKIMGGLSNCFSDYRDRRYVEHSVEELLSQRIMGIALGYEDLNDHDQLRLDPLLAMLSCKEDILGENRSARNQGKALAGHSTLNRLELSSSKGVSKYHKIFANAEKIEAYLLAEGVKAIPRRSRVYPVSPSWTD